MKHTLRKNKRIHRQKPYKKKKKYLAFHLVFSYTTISIVYLQNHVTTQTTYFVHSSLKNSLKQEENNMKPRHFLSSIILCFLITVPSQAATLPENSKAIISTTRNHLVTMLNQIKPKIYSEIPDTINFKDIESGIWYETAARYMVHAKIMAGTSSTTFSPNSYVTRGLAATVMANANQADLGVYTNVFHDANSQWYKDAANWCAVNEIMVGYSDVFFGGEDPVTREQLATILYSYEELFGVGTQSTNDSALSRYTDHQNTTNYSRNALAWCVNEGLLLGTNNQIRPKENATRGEIAFAVFRLLEG